VAHLVLTVDGVDQVFELKGVVRIGRHPENEIQVLDAQASKRHCEVAEHPAGWVLRDLSTLNGTFVNGERVRGETLLCHRDMIRIGNATLGYSDLAEALAAHPPPEIRRAVSAVATTSVGEALMLPAEREQLLREYLRRIVAAPNGERLHELALAALLALGQGDAGLVLARPDGAPLARLDELEIVHWVGRGRELPTRADWTEQALAALRSGNPTVKTHSHDMAYRVWEPRCTLVAPLGHAQRRLALLGLEFPAEQPPNLADIELCARIAGAVLVALAGSAPGQ
jgi:pSer/pThr/pTyr-binding forkhead associated (FHA) protein